MKKRRVVGNKTWEYESDDPEEVALISKMSEFANCSKHISRDDDKKYISCVNYAGNYAISKEAGDISRIFEDNSEEDGWNHDGRSRRWQRRNVKKIT